MEIKLEMETENGVEIRNQKSGSEKGSRNGN